jgi:PST family polysaccharide transporter
LNGPALARRGAAHLGLRYGLGFLANLAGTIVLARSGGPELWGMVAVSQLVLAMFAFLSLGPWGFLIQHGREPGPEEVGSCYLHAVLVAIGFAGIVLFAAPAFAAMLLPHLGSESEQAALLALAWSAIAGGCFYGVRYVAVASGERRQRYEVAMWAELSDLVAFNGTAIVLAAADRPLEGAILGNVLRGPSSALVAHLVLGGVPRLRVSRAGLRAVTRFSRPFVGLQVLQWLPSNAGPVVAGAFLGVADLGILQLAVRTVEYARVLVTVGGRLAFGLSARGDPDAATSPATTARTLDALLALLVPGMAAIVSLAPLWVPRVYGPEWQRMSEVMMLVMFPFLVMAMISMLAALLAGRGELAAPLRLYAAHNLLYWPALALFCGAFGLVGLPAAEWAALAACTLLLPAVHRRLQALRLSLARAAVALTATAAAAAVWIAGAHGHAALAIGAYGTLAALWFGRAPVRAELRSWVRP